MRAEPTDLGAPWCFSFTPPKLRRCSSPGPTVPTETEGDPWPSMMIQVPFLQLLAPKHTQLFSSHPILPCMSSFNSIFPQAGLSLLLLLSPETPDL